VRARRGRRRRRRRREAARSAALARGGGRRELTDSLCLLWRFFFSPSLPPALAALTDFLEGDLAICGGGGGRGVSGLRGGSDRALFPFRRARALICARAPAAAAAARRAGAPRATLTLFFGGEAKRVEKWERA